MVKPRFIYQVMIKCAPEADAEFNKWYNEVHMPLVMKGGMMKAATRYRVTDAVKTDAVKYMTVCEFEDRATFDKWMASDVLAVAKADRERQMAGKAVEWTGRAFYEPIAQFGK